MPDIASLGLRIDSSDTVKATNALDAFAKAAKPAADGATALEKAAASAGNGVSAIGKAATTGAKGTDSITKSGALARHELINLGRQAQDVGVSLLGGQSPFTVLAQQGSQIFDVFSSSKTGTVSGAIKQIGSGIASVISPMRLLVAGTAAAATAGYLIYSSFKQATLQLDNTARAVGTTTGALRSLQTAAEFKGIDTAEFQAGMAKFGASVYDARNNMGGLADVFRANNMSAKDFNSSLEKAADLIKNATSDQQRLQLLQQMGLPATMEWVRFLSQGKEGLRAAAEQAVKFGESAEGQMIAKARAFDEAWNKSWANWKQQGQSAILTIADGVQSLSDKGTALLMKLPGIGGNVAGNVFKMAVQDNTGSRLSASSPVDDFYKGTGAGAGDKNAPKPTVDPAVLQRQIALQQQSLGLLGQTVTGLEAVRQVELAVQQARLSGVSIDQKRVETLKTLAREQTIGVTAIKASTDAANVDAATIGMAVGPANAYAAAQNAINEAKRVGRTLSASDIASINANAGALGAAAQNADNLRTAYEGLVRGPLQTFQQQIAQGSKFFDALKASGVSALNAVSSKLADMAAQSLWTSAFGGLTGGAGSFFSSLFGGSGAAAQASSAATLAGGTGGAFFGPGFASGTDSAPGGLARVNEQGGEIMNLPNGTQVIPHDVSMAMASRVAAPAANDSAGPQAVHVDVQVSVDQSGNLQAFVKNVAQSESAKSITGFVNSPAFVNNVGMAARKAAGQRK